MSKVIRITEPNKELDNRVMSWSTYLFNKILLEKWQNTETYSRFEVIMHVWVI